jgi:hypothetical protein
MKEIVQFTVARKALKKLYPSWQIFIDEVLDRMQSFYLGTQSREELHFIHLIGYGKRQKAKEILTDLLELLDWESESVFLWDNEYWNQLSSFAQVQAFQKLHPVFPKVVVTDFFIEFFAEAFTYSDRCDEFILVENFLRDRKKLDFIGNGRSSDARGGLVISYHSSFGDCDFRRTRVIFEFLWENPIPSFEQLRTRFVPEALERMIDLGYLEREETIFFSNDEPRHIKYAFDLINLTRLIEKKGQELLGIPVSLTLDSMDYFIQYSFYKKLCSKGLLRLALDYFIPVLSQYPRMSQNITIQPKFIQLDFQGGWKFRAVSE